MYIIYAHAGEESSQGCVSLLVGAGSERRVGERWGGWMARGGHFTPNTNLIE